MKEVQLSTRRKAPAGFRTKASAVIALLCCLSLWLPLSAAAQTKHTISGTVTDARGPLSGASVVVKGTNVGTTTDAKGTFSIPVEAGATLVVSYMGDATQEISTDGKAHVDVVMETGATNIEDVVVVGYGTQKKSLVTGAISKVSGNDLEKTGIINAAEALAGKVSGVQIISDNGQPGAGLQILVRGVGSNNSNGNNPIYIVDGMAVSGISYLNSSDIESIEVLKDAAAAAIYGARGGNGVVLITTKRGKPGAPTIEYNFTYGISNLPHKLPLLNAKEYATIRNEMSTNAGNPPQFSDDEIDQLNQGTDWQEAILNRNAPTVQHNLSLRGGSESTTWALSGSYLDQNGIFAEGKSNYKRYTATFNGEQKFLKGSVLRVGQNIAASRVINNSITSNSVLSGPLTFALNMDPLTPVYDDYSQYADYKGNEDYYALYHGFAYSRLMGSDYANPVAWIYFMNPSSYWTTVKANVYAELTILKDFKLRASTSADMTWTQTYSYSQPRRFNPSTSYNDPANGTSQSSGEDQTFNNSLYLTWGKTFGGVHDVSAMAGTESLKYTGLTLSGSRDGLLTTDPSKAFLSLAKGPNQGASGGPNDPHSILSYFGRVNYAYDGRYLMTATLRVDGSSRFGANNRFAKFPSVSAGWNASKEKFMQNVRFVDALKVRASWGQNGNENIGDFRYLSTVSTASQLGYVFDSRNATAVTPGGAPLRLANPNLKWETSEQTNIGFDATIFRDWTVTADYYIKTTKDQLVYSPIPLFLGADEPLVNAGNVRNRGFEFLVDYRKTFHNGLFVDVNANISFNKNKVTYVGTDSKFVSGANVSGIGEITRMEEGYPMAYFRGLHVLGVFQNWDQINNYTYTDPATGTTKLIQPAAKPGDLMYADENGDGTIDSQDRTMIGNPYPKAIYGFNLSASWKGIDLVITTAGAAGQQVFSAVRRVQSPNNWGTWVLGRWTGEGTSNSIPRLTDNDTNGNWSTPSDLYIQNGDYFRIRSVALGYTFSRIPEKYYLKKVRVFVAVNNLSTFTKYNRGYDPEIGATDPLSVGIDLGNYPRARMISFGANLTF